MERPALEARGVSKRYEQRDALCGVDLIVEPGSLHGLLGPNGAGKTTLLRVLLGLVRRDAGSVRLLGRDFDFASGSLPDGVAGFVETPGFYPYLSGRKNLALLARLDGAPASGTAACIDLALDQVGLSDRADATVSGYSAGMRQRLGIAAALLRSPQLLFLDEPMSSLDPAAARDVRALARSLADGGVAVVMSSHDMADVEVLCTKLTVIDRGRVVFAGAVDELRMRAPAETHALTTSDDRAALDLANRRPGVLATIAHGGGLDVAADAGSLDAYIIALGCAGIAVRSLNRRARSLESLFLDLTGNAETSALVAEAS
jgi:ABC-2 type transport system ATP-binding protein